MDSDDQPGAQLPDGGLPTAPPIPNGRGIGNLASPSHDVRDGQVESLSTLPEEPNDGARVVITSPPSEGSDQVGTMASQACAEVGVHPLSRRKRKSPEQSSETDETQRSQEIQKKVKLDIELVADHANRHVQPQVKDNSQGRVKSILPPEIWHHIFTFCPPKSLGNLLSVNKLFNRYLDPSSVTSGFPVSVTKGLLSPLKPNAIWQASRRLYWPRMPAPLRSKTELDMWRLACSPVCQSCRKIDTRGHAHLSDIVRTVRGPDGIAVIWPFARCMCITCLLKTSIKACCRDFHAAIRVLSLLTLHRRSTCFSRQPSRVRFCLHSLLSS